MKTLLIFLLLCWLSSADGLKCYSCMATNNNICNRYTAPCEAPHDTCMSIVEKTGNHKTIIKKCATSDFCSLATSGASIAQAVTNIEPPIVTCCSTDLCNYSGATTARLHTLLLALPLCVISALCYVSA